jgi:lactate dehydrogenase-like 2-hydroxyacid dehydrogenase
MGSMPERKPHVVCLGTPNYAGEDYISNFSKDFDFEALDAKDREQAVSKLPALIKQNGPVDAFIVRMGTPPYEPFDFFGPLTPSCKVITSASAGYNEFDIDWMSKNGIIFCNSVDAVAEATADMAMFLILSTLRNAANAEKSVKAGKWRSRAGLVPARDPTGLTLGIVGMGAIGKVRLNCFANVDARYSLNNSILQTKPRFSI